MVNGGWATKVGGIAYSVLLGIPGFLMFLTGLIMGLDAAVDGSEDAIGFAVLAVAGALAVGGGAYLLYKGVSQETFQLIIDETGVRVEGTSDQDWHIGWFELAGVWISTARKIHANRMGAALLVRLEFIPIDHWRFAHDHPRLQPYFGRQNNYGAYRFPLGPGKLASGILDDGLRTFAQGRYRGIVDEGIAWGFRYS